MQQPPGVGKYFLLGLAVIAAIILADQYTKWLVIDTVVSMDKHAGSGFFSWLLTQKKIEFFINERETFKTVALTPFLNFVMVWNQGISFGMLDTNSPHMPLVFISISAMASLLMLIWLALATQGMQAFSLMLIIGGALANVMDRVRFGAVADFIDLHAGAYHWPAFNLADSCIVLGAGIMVICTFIGDRGKK
ncbi:MAG: signal peptidase II [Alphaproteobacteria bacterium]|nr:signal peptidase II [Alphaproteobacteria bacterium]